MCLLYVVCILFSVAVVVQSQGATATNTVVDAVVLCDRCGKGCGDNLACCTPCGARFGECKASCGVTCDLLVACPNVTALPNCSVPGTCSAPNCSSFEQPNSNSFCGLIPSLPIVTASVGASTQYVVVPTVKCGNVFPCVPNCQLSGCTSCSTYAGPSSDLRSCASANLTFAQRHCRHIYGEALCASNTSSCGTPAIVPAEQRCETEVGSASACVKTTVPSICTGVNTPCTCRFDLGCVLLSVDPDNIGDIKQICVDPLLARVRYMAITGEAPTDIPYKAITNNRGKFNCTNTLTSSNADPVNQPAVTAESTIIHDDLEKAYACCVAKTTNSSALSQCVHTHIAHGVKPSTAAGANANTNFAMRSHTLATCPYGVTLSNQDLIVHCQCMQTAHLIVTGLSYPGGCVVSHTAASKKRGVQQTNSGIFVTQMDNTAPSSTTGSSATTGSSEVKSSSSGLVASLVALVSLLVAKLLL